MRLYSQKKNVAKMENITPRLRGASTSMPKSSQTQRRDRQKHPKDEKSRQSRLYLHAFATMCIH